MSVDPRLERYLSDLESALRAFPVADRAEIITEIKSHVLSALERDPHANLDAVLDAMGAPSSVASRYLLERGLKPQKPPVSPIVKWIVIAFLGSIAMILLFFGFLFSRIGPIKIDGKNERVSIGGIIDVDGKNQRVKIMGVDKSFEESVHTAHVGESTEEGDEPVTKDQEIMVLFANGGFQVKTNEQEALHWECAGRGHISAPSNEKGHVTFDLRGYDEARCTLKIPPNKKTILQGDNGMVSVLGPHSPTDVVMKNGKIGFHAAADTDYHFDVSVQTGSTDQFKSSTNPNAIPIRLSLEKGRISFDGKDH